MPNKYYNLIRHVSLNKVDSSKSISKVDVSGHFDEEMIERPFIEQFGFTSYPPENATGMAIMPDGYVENGVVIGLDTPQNKPKRIKGEAVVYDAFGNKIHLQNGKIDIVAFADLNLNVTGNVTINCTQANINAKKSCTVETPEFTVNGNISLNGDVGSTGGNFSIGGSGGTAVARVGDKVRVGDQVGEIISGSSIATSK